MKISTKNYSSKRNYYGLKISLKNNIELKLFLIPSKNITIRRAINDNNKPAKIIIHTKK